MTMPIPLPSTSSTERFRRLSIDALRERALERLYERRCAVQNLIGALEDYQRSNAARRAHCVDISAFVQTCSSDSAQSQI